MMGIGESSFSPGVQRAVSHTGAYLPFEAAEKQIRELAGVHVDAKSVERISKEIGAEIEEYNKRDDRLTPTTSTIGEETVYLCMDGTGIPMHQRALEGRKGKNTEQAKTREVKLGCIFTQLENDIDGYPIRKEESTTYWGGIINAENFGEETEAAAKARKVDQAKRLCIISDGATWIWNIADEYFPGAIQIVDLYHAREHYWEIGRMFFENASKELYAWTDKRKKELNDGNVNKIIRALKKLIPRNDDQRKAIDRAIGYYDKHRKRMRYKLFRENGLFVGSGVLEAGCRSVIGQRLKQSGMHWSLKGAASMIALRCCIFSNQWEDFWEKRAA